MYNSWQQSLYAHTKVAAWAPLCLGTGASRTWQDCPWETVGHKGLQVSLWHNFIRKSELRGVWERHAQRVLGVHDSNYFIHTPDRKTRHPRGGSARMCSLSKCHQHAPAVHTRKLLSLGSKLVESQSTFLFGSFSSSNYFWHPVSNVLIDIFLTKF